MITHSLTYSERKSKKMIPDDTRITIDEMAQLFDNLKLAYPQFYSDVPPEKAKKAVELWHKAFSHFDYGQVQTAAEQHIRTSRFTPNIADIYDIAAMIPPTGDGDY